MMAHRVVMTKKAAGAWYTADLETTLHAANETKTAALYAAVKNDGSQLLFTYYTSTPSWASGYTSLGKVSEMDDYRGLILLPGTYRFGIAAAGGGSGSSADGGGSGGWIHARYTFSSTTRLILCVGAPGVRMHTAFPASNGNQWGGYYEASNFGRHYKNSSWMDSTPNSISSDAVGAYGYGFGGALDSDNPYVGVGYSGTGGGATAIVIADSSWYMSELLMCAGAGAGAGNDEQGGVGIGATQYGGGNQNATSRSAFGAQPSSNGNGASGPNGNPGKAGFDAAIYTSDLTRRHGGNGSNAGGGGGGGYYAGGGSNHGGAGGGNGFRNTGYSAADAFSSGEGLTSSNNTRQRTRYDWSSTYFDVDALFPFLSNTTTGDVSKIGYGGLASTNDGVGGPGCIIIEKVS